MEKKVFLALALLVLFVLGASFAFGAKIWVVGAGHGNVTSVPYNYSMSAGTQGGHSNTRVRVMGFKIWAGAASEKLATLNLTVYNIHNFVTTDLATLGTDYTSGISVIYDSNNDGTVDGVAPLSAGPGWNTVGTANYVGFTFGSGIEALPITEPANFNYYIQFNLSATPTNNAYFNFTLETTDSPITTTTNTTAGAILNATIGSSNLTIDTSAPTISVSQTKDSDKNGFLDSLIVNFAEGIDDTFLNSTGCFRVNSTTGSEVGDVAVSTGETGNDTILYINWTSNQIQYTNMTPLFNYTQNTSCQIKDIAGNLLASNRDIHSVDGAPPVFWGCIAYDVNLREGNLDHINCTMSENLTSGTVKSSLFSAYVNYGTNTENTALTISSVTTKSTSIDQNNVSIILNNNVMGTGNVSLSYTSAGDGLNDTKNNISLSNATIIVTETAAPRIISIVTRDMNNNGFIDGLNITFSENLSSNNGKSMNETTPGCFMVQALQGGTDGPTGNWTETLDSNYIFLNISKQQWTNTTPKLNITYNNTCYLIDAAGNFLPSVTNRSSDDGAPPVFLGCDAYDNDVDGKLNNLNCTMSENLTSGTIKNSLFSAIVNYGATTDNRALTLSSVTTRANGIGQNNVSISLNDAVYGTGNVSLSYTSAGDGLNDTKNNITLSNATIIVTDIASAVVLSELTLDGNSNTKNGYLDAIQVNFSEGVLDSSFTDDADNITVGSIARASITFNTGDTVNDNVVFLNFTGTAYNTGNTPSVNFSINANNGTSNMTDLTFVNITSNTTVELSTDKAPAVFWNGYSVDMDKNGAVNNINLSLSEALVANSPTAAGFSAYISYGKDASGGYISRALTISSVSAIVAGNVTLTLNNAVYGTGNISLSYTSGQTTEITDGAGNVMVTNSSIIVTDNASAVVLYEATKDSNTNGYLDAIQVNFSESVLDSSFTDDADNITIGSIARSSLTFNTDSVTNDNVIRLYFNGTTTYNTGNVPNVNFSMNPNNGTSNMTDLSGLNISTNTTVELSTDTAAPVFWLGDSYDADANGALDYINLTMSETLKEGTLKSGSWSTLNVNYGPGTRSLTISSTRTNATKAEITLNNAVYGTGAITIAFTAGTDGINDTNGLVAASNASLSASDNASAVVFSELTLDSNSNGYLDAIQVNFSEPVLDSSFVDDSDNITVGSIARQSLTFNTGATANDDEIYLYFNGTTTYNTGGVPNVNFSIGANNGTSNMTDLAFKNITSNTSVELSTDRATPVFWTAYTTDEDKNGALDTINISTSEATGTALEAGPNGKGTWAATVNYGPGTRTLTISAKSAQAAGNVTLELNNAVFGTGAITLSYTQAAGGINDSAGNLLITNTTITVTDNASASVLSEQTQDINSNGYLDAILVNFSEPVLDSSFVDDSDNITVGSIARQSLTFNTGATANDGEIYLYFNGTTTYNTGGVPNVNFSISANNGTSNMTDLAFVNITSNTSIELSTDTASPVIWSKGTLSFNRTGYLDTINITFSESVVDNTSASAGGPANFTIEGISTWLYDTAFPGDSANNAYVYLGFTGTTYFTNGTPMVNFSHGGATAHDNLADSAGNKVARNDTPAAGVTATDTAPPVLLSAVASDGATAANNVDSDDYIMFTFSEQINFTKNRVISNTTVNSTKTADAIFYLNATGSTWALGWGVDIGRFNNSQNTTMNVTFANTNSNLSAPDIYLIFMNWTVIDMNGKAVIQDNKTNVSLTGSFQDVQVPSVSSWWTNDSNANGYIDSIVVTMSEAVNNDTGRCGLGWNVSNNVTAQNYSVNTFLSTCENSTRVNITVTELTVFDTNVTVYVNYTSAIGVIRDTTNNNKLGDANSSALDKARPVLLNATTFDGDEDGYIDAYNLTFSENVTDGSFNWTGETAPVFSGANHGFSNVTGTKKNDIFINLNFADGNVSHTSNATPDLTNSFINDTAGNAMLDLVTADLSEYDNASPVFWTVNGYVNNFTNRSGKDGWLLNTKFRTNQNISIKFNVSENVTQPTVTVAGNAATLVGTTNTTAGNGLPQVQYEYYYVVQGSETEGTVTLLIRASDLTGKASMSNADTNTSQNLTVDYKVTRVPRLTLVDQPQDTGAGLKLNWTAISDDDFLKYSFHCNLTNSSNLADLTAVSTSGTVTDSSFTVKSYHDGTNTTLTDGTSYYCVINVSDSIGNVNTSINVTSIPYANGNVSLTANKWQMIGTPKYLNNTKFSSTGFSTSDSVQYYNATDATWYSFGISTDRMYQLKGYWIYNYDGLQVNTTYRTNTGGTTPESITLFTGWNLIGSPTNTAGTNVTTKLNNALGSTKWSIIWHYNVSDSIWYYNTPTGEGDLGVFNVDGGYWISMTSAGNSTVYTGEP